MNIYELIEFLQEQPNKELDVIMRGATGWFSVCGEDSKVEEFDGEGAEKDKFFVLNPCYGHEEETKDLEINADDFEINKN